MPRGPASDFDALTDDPQGGTAGVERVLAMSPQSELNYSLTLLDRWPGRVLSVNLCPKTPAPGDAIFLLGFPGGRGLEVSIDDNEVVAPTATHSRAALANAADVLLYKAPTEGGSSGSPVFNADWELAGIHMGGDPVRRVNYGAVIDSVLAHA